MIDIEKTLKSELDSELSKNGYAFDDNCYFRSSENALTYFLSFDFSESEYRVFVGINHTAENRDINKAPGENRGQYTL